MLVSVEKKEKDNDKKNRKGLWTNNFITNNYT